MRLIPFKIFFLLCIMFPSCTKEFGTNCVEGTGSIEKRTLDLESLTKLDLGIPGHLYINEGPQNIEIEAPSDVIDLIMEKSSIGSERWIIEIDDCYDGPEITVWATLPKFVALDVSGSGDISTLDTLRNVENLNLEIDGSGNMDLQLLDANKLDLEVSGSGNITFNARNPLTQSYDIAGSGNIITKFEKSETCRMRIKGSGNITTIGTTTETFMEIEGQGNLLCENLCSSTCDINMKGSGNCDIKVTDRLNINIEGSGNICYFGQPVLTSIIDGSGTINNCN